MILTLDSVDLTESVHLANDHLWRVFLVLEHQLFFVTPDLVHFSLFLQPKNLQPAPDASYLLIPCEKNFRTYTDTSSTQNFIIRSEVAFAFSPKTLTMSPYKLDLQMALIFPNF